MKLFVFLIFAGCAVKCDESSNYYVIERPSDPPVRELRPFHVYWNVPTFQCKSKKIIFDQLFEKYGIIQNQNDAFQGEQITILYDPGLFPAILKEESSGKLRTRNGGVPQEGNLDEHLTAFRYVLDQSIPDPQFSGMGVIDFESWRPIFRQNSWGVLTPYRNLSLHIERRLHPWWTKNMIEREAKSRFERAGREFMQATVALARLLRPQAKWGYYGFPYCFNMAGSKPAETCSNIIQKENDQISWLWTESTALYPSVYSSKNLSSGQLAGLIRGRVAESARVGGGMPILPYFWFKYRDAGFMSEVDLKTALKAMYKSHTSGLILWGSSNDVNTVTRCEKLKTYLDHVLGPEIAKYTKQTYKLDESNIMSNNTNNLTTQNPFFFMTGDSKDDENQKVDSENEETDQNSEAMESHIDDIINTRTNNSYNATNENNILLDIVLSLIKNIQKRYDKKATEATMKKISKDRKKGTPIHDTFIQNNENEYDFTTKTPIKNLKKKSALFALLFAPKNTTVLLNSTSATENNVTDDYKFQSTSLEFTSTTEDPLGNDQNFKSTTIDMLFDDNNKTLYYDQDTFMDEDLNFTTVRESVSETVYNEGETTTAIFFDDDIKYTTNTEPNLNSADAISSKIYETTVPIFFDNAFNYTMSTESTTTDFYEGQSTTEYKISSTSAKESPILTDTYTKYDVLSTTDRTTTEDDTVNDTVNDDDEYQVVINLE